MKGKDNITLKKLILDLKKCQKFNFIIKTSLVKERKILVSTN
jgi:hypothetical protein